MQHRVLEILKWQIQSTFQSGFVYGGDFEKRKQKRDFAASSEKGTRSSRRSRTTFVPPRRVRCDL